jgi:glycosyltransferase involved in cell wall biosynthesis
MRHAALSFVERVRELETAGGDWDVMFCTDMLNLAEFRGLAGDDIARLPAVAYFHENQLTYPSQAADERDLHFAFTNMLTGLAADRVWFNSAFHRDEFLTALDQMLRRMPDHQPLSAVERIRSKSSVFPPGIEPPLARPVRQPDHPLRLVWASRWEHDKGPETFFAALRLLRDRGIDFRLNVLGESFGQVPACFEVARQEFSGQITRWGFLADRAEYQAALSASDVAVSTANHEFFGIAMVEAVAAGCFPLAPRRLAYPEVLGTDSDWFHDGSAEDLARRLIELDGRLSNQGRLWTEEDRSRELIDRFAWDHVATDMDRALTGLVSSAE